MGTYCHCSETRGRLGYDQSSHSDHDALVCGLYLLSPVYLFAICTVCVGIIAGTYGHQAIDPGNWFLSTHILSFSLTIQQITRKLFPFMVISCFIILVFAFAYFAVELARGNCEYDEGGLSFCDADPAILRTFVFFFSGPENTSSWQTDILFGVIVVVVQLNVLIAIVTDSYKVIQVCHYLSASSVRHGYG